MIIAALIVFGSLLAAWLVAPAEPRPWRTDARRAAQRMPAHQSEALAEAA